MTAQKLCKQPVVAIVGHIDHGKTTLLDYIRKATVAEKEEGGITQRVSAYEVLHKGAEGEQRITFIDTPGHEAFQKMRRRAGRSADIAILIVASDDGVKPQTIEAHKAIEEAKIPFIVAFTKIDKDTSNIEKAKESVSKHGIYLEGLGGEVPYIGISSKTGEGIPELLDLITLVADLNSISCDANGEAAAVVLESSRDAKIGINAIVIIREGTLKIGGFAVAGNAIAPLRIIEDFSGTKVKEICCGKPARIVGFSEEPKIGSTLTVVDSKKEAEARASEFVRELNTPNDSGDVAKEAVIVRMALKADTAGSLEALEHELAKISVEGVELRAVSKNVGPISETDVKNIIGFEPAFIVGFNVKIENGAKDLAERNRIQIETKPIIYELADWLLEEATKHKPITVADTATGEVEIIKHFSTAGSKHVVGGRVLSGKLSMHDKVIIMRRGIEVGTGKVINLQQAKKEVANVAEGLEFGAQIDTKADVVAGDKLLATKK
ncbi:GTP-binding protein [Patescibacteria group bacterium]|nr:MAG: GTP-binding protein [Patescibacteria group bacterium]